MCRRPFAPALLVLALLAGGAAPATSAVAQMPVEGEVRQIVTFSFLPARSAEALDLYRERALPLYRADEAMLSFRAFREVESPVPLDLMVVSSFQGMAGMDRSNERLRELAAEDGSSIGAIYGAIGALSSSHTDQFVAMLPALGSGDPASRRLTAFVWYRVEPGRADAFERALASAVVPREAGSGTPSATGRFLVSDGWDYLRVLGFDSLGDYQAYWIDPAGGAGALAGLTAERRQVIVTGVRELSVR